MAKGLLNGVLRHLRRAALLCEGADLTDGELLECYLARRDEAAFESLLLRHGPMVLGVCRRVLRNEADAHDAFQATFLVFVRKAGSIVPRARVGNWLHGVAHKTALKARAMNRLRRAKERQAAVPPDPPSAGALQEVLAMLDEALGRLPAKYRAPVVLCHLEEKSLQEAARQLGCPQGTVASRLARAREMLAKRLAGRGQTLGAGALGAALAQGVAPPAVRAALFSSTVQAATAVASGRAATAGLIAPEVVALTEGVLRTMLLTKLKTLTAGVLALALLGAGVTYGTLQAGQKGAKGEAQSAPAAAKEDKAKSDKELLQGTWVPKSGEKNGAKWSEEQLKKWGQLVFADDKVTREAAEQREGAYTIDPDKKPKEMDLFTEANTWKAIYELKGTTLTLALRFGDDRPTEFDSQGALLIVFEKKK
jgi:RNA polymerase sigma factor (sigma-70 family)